MNNINNHEKAKFNLLHLAFILQGIPVVAVGICAGMWLADMTMPNQITTGLLVATAAFAFCLQRQTKKLIISIKADRETATDDRLSRIARNIEILELITAHTKLALLLNVVGFGILLI